MLLRNILRYIIENWSTRLILETLADEMKARYTRLNMVDETMLSDAELIQALSEKVEG